MKFIIVFGLVCLVASTLARPATNEEEYDDAEEEQPPPPPPPKKITPVRTSPLAARRNPLTASKNKGTTTTTTTTTPTPEEEVVEDEELPEDEQPEEVNAETEPPKKFIKGGIIRPFRSNDDLLAILKKRRDEVNHNKHNHKVVSDAEESAPAPVSSEPVAKSKPSSSIGGGRKRFNSGKSNSSVSNAAENPSAEENASAPAASPALRTGRRFKSFK